MIVPFLVSNPSWLVGGMRGEVGSASGEPRITRGEAADAQDGMPSDVVWGSRRLLFFAG